MAQPTGGEKEGSGPPQQPKGDKPSPPKGETSEECEESGENGSTKSDKQDKPHPPKDGSSKHTKRQKPKRNPPKDNGNRIQLIKCVHLRFFFSIAKNLCDFRKHSIARLNNSSPHRTVETESAKRFHHRMR